VADDVRQRGAATRRRATALLLAAAGAAMLVWTWGTWPDVLVDFGGELYVPWRLAQGDVLYRDVAYFTGPLSPYLNAAVFRVLGASVLSLVVANLAILVGIAVLLHRLVSRVAGELAAAGALVFFLALFAFAQLESIGNSNYVCPYSHETTHGTLIALAALLALARWLESRPKSRKNAWVAAIGLCLGLAFLTKVEVFLALAAAVLLGFLLAFRADPRGLARSATLLAACAILPVAFAWAALSTAMPVADALHGTLGAWPYTLGGGVADLPFYRRLMGTDRPGENAARLALFAGRWLLVFGPAALAALCLRGRMRTGPAALVVGLVAGAGALLAVRPSAVAWIEAGRPLPVFAAVVLAVAVARRSTLSAAFAAWALVLLAKMLLRARINMYGYALAMPAAMLVVAALLAWIPARIERAGGSGALFRGFALGVLGVAVFAHLEVMGTFLAQKTVHVGEGRDAFLADARGSYVNAAVAAAKAGLPPGGTLAVLPEGVMINFLARARTPARYINYMPPEVLMFGEDRILADLERAPPDLVLLVHKSTAEYGLPWFGVDYGRRLMAFLRERYAPGALLGGEPLRPETRFGLRILQRR